MKPQTVRQAILALLCMLACLAVGTPRPSWASGEAIDPAPWEGRFLGRVMDWQVESLGAPDASGAPALSVSAQSMHDSATWQKGVEDVPNFGVNSWAWWFRLQFAEGSLAQDTWLLEIAYPILDELEYHVFVDGVQVAQDRDAVTDGIRSSGPLRLLPHRHYLYALPVTPRPVTVLLRLKSPTSVQLPATVWREAAFIAKEERELLLGGGYTGIMLAMILFNLFLAVSGSLRGYFLYVGMVSSVAAIQMVLMGYAQRFLPVVSVEWSTVVFPRLVLCAMFFTSAFCDEFLQLDRHRDPLRHPYRILRWLALGAFVVAGWLPVSVLVTFAVLLCLGGAFFSAVLIVRHYDSGDRAVLYFCMAWVVFVTGTFLITLNKLDILPRNEITEYLLPIGSVFECVLLSLALGERINQERRQKRAALLHAMTLDQQEAEAHADAMRHVEVARKAQEITLRMKQESNATLEKKVEERSKELADINQRLEELTRLDPLTGVRNRRFMHQRLREEFQRAFRAGQSLAVLMVDIDHFKQVNDRHGHLVGDDALKAVADCLSCGVEGPGAMVTRFGGEEFCVLLPYANAVVAQRIAERLRKVVQDQVVMSRGHVLRLTVSIGCFSAIPQMGQLPEEWLERADLALYDAKRQGRNRVCCDAASEGVS